VLARQVEELQRSSSEAAGAAASAAEQIQFFRSQVEELTAREAEARVEVAAAAERVEGLLQELEELRRRERDARAGPPSRSSAPRPWRRSCRTCRRATTASRTPCRSGTRVHAATA